MKFNHESTYDATAAQVFAMLMDPAFREKAAAASGALSADATVDGTRVVINEEQTVAGVPSFAKKFVGSSNKVIHREEWDAAGTAGSITIETPGKPVSLKGRVTLSESGGRTTHAYEMYVTATVPLVGGKLEKLVADLTKQGFEKEHAVGVAWLA